MILLLILLALVAIGAVYWSLQNSSKKALEAELKAIEKKINETEEEIKRLSDLSPEELEKRQKEDAILSAQSAAVDVSVAGVEITISGNKKLIKNTEQGYSLELPKNLLLARSISSDHLEFHDKDLMCQGDPSCQPIILIEAATLNPGKLSLEDWFKSEEEKAGSQIYSPRKLVTFNGISFYQVTESLLPAFDGYYYYWSKGEYVYYLRISKFNEEFYSEYLKTIKLF